MSKHTLIAVDLAKNVFEIEETDAKGLLEAFRN